ncbi:ankyrin repeat protein, partial [Trifolium pratense]
MTSTMMSGDRDNILLNISPEEVNDFLGEYTWEGKWENVIMLYYEYPEQAHRAIISDSTGTALHVAIDLDEENVVKELVNAILIHNSRQENIDERVEALEMQNERGDTPLHFAASRGFARISAINWRKQTFAYLAHISKERVTLQDLVREDGDSILHTAIRGEYFDLAVIIVHHYDFLSTHLNKEESTPLKVLATRPSAFKSASNLSWYKRILYH